MFYLWSVFSNWQILWKSYFKHVINILLYSFHDTLNCLIIIINRMLCMTSIPNKILFTITCSFKDYAINTLMHFPKLSQVNVVPSFSFI